MQAIGKWQQNASWTSLLAGLLVVIGLTCAGIWTNVLGYSTSLFAPDGIGYPTSSAFLQGRLVISVVLVVLARQIHKQWHWLVAVTGFVMCLVTCCAVLAPSQGMFDPQALSHISIVCGSMGYTILTTSFYILLAEHLEVRPSALVIAVSLALETVFSVLVSTQVTALGQAILVLVAPPFFPVWPSRWATICLPMAPRAAPTPTCTKSHIPQEAAGTRFFGCSPSPLPSSASAL